MMSEKVQPDLIEVSSEVSEIDDNYDDYEGHLSKATEQVDSAKKRKFAEDEDESVNRKKNNPVLKLANDIDKNNDFIAFSESSSDEEEVKEDGDEGVDKDGATILNTDFPWIINHDHSKQKEVADWLTLEIRDFVSYISPNRTEIEMRNQTINNIRNSIKEHWPDADLHVFGSYATDLYLPGSDIDCVINSNKGDKGSRSLMYSLASFLKRKGLATDITIIANARVPIIKFVEPVSGIHIDVSFERDNGLDAANIIRSWLTSTPSLRELVLIVKQFLNSRRLNDVHTGGLGGFSIICLVYSFLSLHPRIITKEIDARENLGILLIDFFELYGKNFGYDHVALTVRDNQPKYLPKSQWKGLNAKNSFTLAIQDPGDETNNISRGSFNLRDIKKAFAGAFDLLTNRCFELEAASFKDRLGKSILGNVIKYRGVERDFNDDRGLVKNKAIEENKSYIKKRSSIVHDAQDLSDDERQHPRKRNKTSSRKKPVPKENNEDEDDDYIPVLE
ncbi:hypothetical protein TPHA_0P01280 [Tetrapisispora phaffii CBS 4417]|uniref:polynucleotide adenylyltransferase n=1 Tax=Tetrapisispora phaffii (strain ATCC 24235 / CBS 4417 / NBRC 1672 / NRRL Y-8282 / UCD 70-5) TaxID=1071381 RepID=G8C2A8_TETPH|nr:hypothetical protein TPHA_0P01280 [Tetrapisispora phaffii CBS 4417]CCE66286.1 hypothetical protein TPHA_0P01280 [Tetrapisispora phaffii CBS 4417]